MNYTVKEIVEKYLQENGYDGLFNSSGECACKIGDLIPCWSEGLENCRAGHLVPCPGPEHCEAAACGESCWHIGIKE